MPSDVMASPEWPGTGVQRDYRQSRRSDRGARDQRLRLMLPPAPAWHHSSACSAASSVGIRTPTYQGERCFRVLSTRRKSSTAVSSQSYGSCMTIGIASRCGAVGPWTQGLIHVAPGKTRTPVRVDSPRC